MTHYVCTGGCNLVSEQQGACTTGDCIKYHKPLSICHCADGLHREALENPNFSFAEEVTHET